MLVQLARPSPHHKEVRPSSQHSPSASCLVTAPPQPQPSLTTEYTPRERGGVTKLSTPQPPSGTPQPTLPSVAATPGATEKVVEGEKEVAKDVGPDPNTLPPATAPPSHPSINPAVPGTLDGRSILEVDLNALAEKPWRRPGSDLSDWFNYGFDEISWESYCYRRRELGDIAGMLKSNVLVRALSPTTLYAILMTPILCDSYRTSPVCPRTSLSASHPRSARWSWQARPPSWRVRAPGGPEAGA